jgi:hypothetical protein
MRAAREPTKWESSFRREGETMRCPHCAAHVLERWQPLFTHTDAVGSALPHSTAAIPNAISDGEEEQELEIVVSWMECPNWECRKIILVVEETFKDAEDSSADEDGVVSSDSWFAYPKRTSDRAVDPSVPLKMASDYREASAILNDSPKASAAIARRILADILEEFGGYKQFQLSKRIEGFADDAKHPSTLRENAKYLVQLGDFAAHTQKDQTTEQIVDVEPGEAEWTLDVIDGMFDYFIVGPARDRARRAAVDEKLRATGRKPIRPPKK